MTRLLLAALLTLPAAFAQATDTTRCEQLGALMSKHWPDATTRIVSANLRPAGPLPESGVTAHSQAPVTAPEHCEVVATMHERVGVNAQHYAIRFHLRLPSDWNGRFLFQGGGGSNGVLGDALGSTFGVPSPPLLEGFAVVSQDSGHDNAVNTDPSRAGAVAFGFDPQARADYGYASLKPVAEAAKAAIGVYYGQPIRYAYFAGCSKGGQEGMAFAQRFPDEFDGILAGAPGFALPRAALAEAWDVQALASASTLFGITSPGARVASAFGESDLQLARDAVLAACDLDDGVKDGMVGNFPACTTDKVRPQFTARTCQAEKHSDCLSAPQVDALLRIFGGPRNAAGKALYSDWQWDTGVAAPGWRLWKMGSADGKIPALNIMLGGGALASVFTVPPHPVDNELQALVAYQLAFDFNRDARQIDAVDGTFRHSAWSDISARSSDLRAFAAHGGKLLVPHGVSDPIFSIHDTLAWYHEVEHSERRANEFVRVFPVPGMTHCGGGASTDHVDAFKALQTWVEGHQAPEILTASAGTSSPWPGRTRPLCAYPKTAHYRGAGDVERAESFVCQ